MSSLGLLRCLVYGCLVFGCLVLCCFVLSCDGVVVPFDRLMMVLPFLVLSCVALSVYVRQRYHFGHGRRLTTSTSLFALCSRAGQGCSVL